MIQAFALSACAIAPGHADAPAPVANVENWRQVGSAVWRFDPAGAEAGPENAHSFLVSPASYADFTLTVEFWIAEDTNSGVFVRCGEVAQLEDVNPFDCYEINLYDAHPNPAFRTGAIVTRVAPLAQAETLGQWNRLEVRARGPMLEVLVNGTRTAVLEDAHTAAGPVALQYAGTGLVRFRKLSIAP